MKETVILVVPPAPSPVMIKEQRFVIEPQVLSVFGVPDIVPCDELKTRPGGSTPVPEIAVKPYELGDREKFTEGV